MIIIVLFHLFRLKKGMSVHLPQGGLLRGNENPPKQESRSFTLSSFKNLLFIILWLGIDSIVWMEPFRS